MIHEGALKGKRHNKDLRRLESGEEDARGSHLWLLVSLDQ